LSRFITPELMYDLRSRLSGAQPLGMGVKCPVRTRTTGSVSESLYALTVASHTLVIVLQQQRPVAGVNGWG